MTLLFRLLVNPLVNEMKKKLYKKICKFQTHLVVPAQGHLKQITGVQVQVRGDVAGYFENR